MERLTEKCWMNLDPWECCGQDKFCTRGCHDKGGCTNGCIVPKLYIKLAQYEDIGLEPEQLREVDQLYAEKCKELAEYRQLEEQGLLLRLPCKVGNALYMPWQYDWNTGVAIITVKKIVIDWENCFYVETDLYSDSEAFLKEYNYGKFSFSDFGKTVFLTKEEAEQALAEMEGV